MIHETFFKTGLIIFRMFYFQAVTITPDFQGAPYTCLTSNIHIGAKISVSMFILSTTQILVLVHNSNLFLNSKQLIHYSSPS